MKKRRGGERMKRRDESGFALLLVFVMAAAISITLYMEVPRMAFESQRAKEQMAIDRGLQYKRAIQLFYRKYQLYPQTLDDLETKRNVRFLRRRYLDPLTGKEWRLLHVGPAGQLTDSLVQPPAPLPGSTTGSSLNPAQGSSQTSAFSQASNPSRAANQAQPVDPNNPNDPNAQQAPDPLNMAARRPSDRIIGRGTGATGGTPVAEAGNEQAPPPEPVPDQPQQPAQPEPTPVETGQPPADPNAPQDPTQQPENPAQPQPPGQQPIPGLPAGAQPPGQPTGQPTAPPIQFPPGIAPAQAGTTGQPAPSTPNTPFPQQGQQPGQPQMPGQPGAPPQTAANLIQNLLTTARQPPSSLNSGFTTGNTGGIAGVASTAEGKGIHVVNDHSKYKEWEFVYDLKKDKSIVGAAGVNQQQQLQQQMQQNQNGAFGSTSSPFSSTPGSSPAASTPSTPAAPAAPTTPPPNQ
jgi:type II secretory pathway pseudopilin PulG